MLLEKINSEELEFMFSWHTPEILIECLFHNFDNLTQFDEEKFGNIRNYQTTMLSQESLFDFESMQEYYSLSDPETFDLRKNVADIYNYGARLFGKTLITEKVDVPISMLHDEGYLCGFTSMDLMHLRGVLDSIANGIKKHPILKQWLLGSIRVHPNYNIEAKNGWVLTGVNMNIKGKKDEGDQFFQRHFMKLWMEEASFENEKVFKKRIEATAEVGMIERFAGMTNFTKHMPAGEAFYKLENRKKILNLPQYVNKWSWSEKKRKTKEKQYGGKSSTDYLVFVEGEIIESGRVEFDMDLVRENYLEKKEIKRFEIRKEHFSRFKDIITVERPKNSESIYVCFKEGTEVLTKTGWKDFKNITYKDKVLSLNPENGQSSYKDIDNIIIQDYDGKMVEYDSETLKFSVTPNHKMFVKKTHHNKFEFIDANKLTESYVKKDIGYHRIGKYWYRKSGKDRITNIKFKAKNSKKYIFELKDWLEFLGWYLSEGCLVRNQYYRIVLSQHNEKYRIEIKSLLNRMNWHYSEGRFGEFILNSKPIFNWLKDNCYEGNEIKKQTIYNCYNKKVPNFVRNLNSELINILLESHIKGDGCKSKDGRCSIVTTSYKLANDLQELILKTGKLASINEREPCINKFILKNGKKYISNCKKSYTINIWRKNVQSKIRPKNLKSIDYKGKVYCVETNPFHTIYVKYKGKSFWCGNCADVGDGAGGTDIIIISEVNDTYRYLYNISLYNLKLEQQIEIFKYIIDNTQANIIGIECGEAFGRNLSDRLEDLYGIEHVIRYAGNKKVKVGFEKDKNGKEIIKDGKPVYKEEFMSEWSVVRLKHLLYNCKFKLPMDYRFDKMLNSVISTITGERKKFLCPSSIGDHLFDSFRVFAIVLWQIRDFKDIKPTSGNEMGCGTDF